MGVILETENLKKTYLGNKSALDSVSLSIQEGRTYGLLGPNGSGKTTFLKIIAGLIKPSGGSFKVCGKEFGIETKKMVSIKSKNF